MLAVRLTDEDTDRLILEPKPVANDYRSAIRLRQRRGHQVQDLDIVGEDGSEFPLIFRQTRFNVLDFSVILAYRFPNSNELFRLRRYNGRSHEHTNRIEGRTFYDFHIHQATERYQEMGPREDSYAEPTDRFAGLDEAFECMIADCGFVVPPQQQGRLL